jgi:four helix bundle protein
VDANEMKSRTRAFALRAIRLVGSLPRTTAADVIGKQLLRCATSVGANYRAACRGRSPSEFVAKMGIVEEEADESIYWLELLADSGIIPREKLADLMGEADQLVRIIVASIRTARSRDKGLPEQTGRVEE